MEPEDDASEHERQFGAAIDRVVETLRNLEQRDRGFVLKAAAARAGVRSSPPHASDTVLARLSKREREVFVFIVDGRSSREIARALCLSPKTIDTHREHIFRKLRVHSIVGLVRLAAQAGLLRFD